MVQICSPTRVLIWKGSRIQLLQPSGTCITTGRKISAAVCMICSAHQSSRYSPSTLMKRPLLRTRLISRRVVPRWASGCWQWRAEGAMPQAQSRVHTRMIRPESTPSRQ